MHRMLTCSVMYVRQTPGSLGRSLGIELSLTRICTGSTTDQGLMAPTALWIFNHPPYPTLRLTMAHSLRHASQVITAAALPQSLYFAALLYLGEEFPDVARLSQPLFLLCQLCCPDLPAVAHLHTIVVGTSACQKARFCQLPRYLVSG